MAGKRSQKGSQFIRFMGPVIEALQDLGGSGRPAEVVNWIATKLDVPEEEQNELIASGQSRFANQIGWARFYLMKTGYVDSSKRGVWRLTTKGLNASLTHQDALSILQEVLATLKVERVKRVSEDGDQESEEPLAPERMDYRTQLLKVLQDLPPEGFERLCQRLLRESGFQQVNVTGRTGDGGIDGNGLLQINPFVSFQVLFQCKRYTGSVGAAQIRDFRGAMMGRAEKGIFMTTGTFTKDAKKEANRDGVPSIELVNGEKLLDMFEQLEMGLKPITAYEVDPGFFEEFRSK